MYDYGTYSDYYYGNGYGRVGDGTDYGYNRYDYYPERPARTEFNPNGGESEKRSEKIGFDVQHLFSISAIFRMFFMVFSLIALIAAATSQTNDDNGLFPSYSATRTAFMIFAGIIFGVQTALFVMDIINAFNVSPLCNWPWVLIILVTDSLLFFAILICSIFMFFNAKNSNTQIRTALGQFFVPSQFYSVDSLWIAAVMGLMMAMLFVEEIIYLAFQLLAKVLADKKAAKAKSSSNYY